MTRMNEIEKDKQIRLVCECECSRAASNHVRGGVFDFSEDVVL